jgi:sortase A
MKLVVPRKSLRLILRSTQCVLAACAVALLGYCAFVLVDGWMFQNRERRHLEQLQHERQEAKSGTIRTVSGNSRKRSPLGMPDSLIGRIEIPRLGLSVIVIEGTSTTSLRRGVGHIPGTALPGQPGNVGISGHRDAYFRPLRNIRQNDIITLITPLREYHYRVVSTRVVGPYDAAVLNPSANEILTLVTCYPFYFVGPAPDRFIVRAERVT